MKRANKGQVSASDERQEGVERHCGDLASEGKEKVEKNCEKWVLAPRVSVSREWSGAEKREDAADEGLIPNAGGPRNGSLLPPLRPQRSLQRKNTLINGARSFFLLPLLQISHCSRAHTQARTLFSFVFSLFSTHTVSSFFSSNFFLFISSILYHIKLL